MFTLVLIGLFVIFSYGMGNVSAASGDSIYVNGTSGNNVYNGQSASYDGTNGPKATIKNATGTVNSNGTIYISKGTYYESNIQINTNMTIIGESQQNTIINGQQSGHSIFTIASGVYLTIINLTLTNGTSDIGGAIANYGNLNVYNSTFINNKASYGGAINNGDDGALTVNNSTFDNNTGTYGGVIWNSGDSSTLTNNTFTNNIGTYGGVIYNEHTGTIIVTNNTFDNNTATTGGAIFNYGTSTETSNTFNNNTATKGGAIYNQGTSTLVNNSFNNNTATKGGAIYNQGTSTLVNNSFNNNTTTNSGYGGAIYNSGTLIINNSTFTNNQAALEGGAVFTSGTLTINNSTFTNNSAPNGYGGAIYNIGGSLTVKDSNFTGNTATTGGAIYNRGTLTVDNSTLTGNTASSGGAISNAGTLTVKNSTLTDNASASFGGAIYNSGTTTPVVNFNRIIGNTANFDGSAIYNSIGTFDAKYNWWGSNTNPYANIGGISISYGPWIVLKVTSNPTTININGISDITADLEYDSDGVYHDPVNGHVPDGITVNFYSDGLGTLNPIVSTITNGSTNTTFTGHLSGVSMVSATVDDQTGTTNVNINKISTTITVDPISGLKGKTVNLTATLTDSDGNPVSGTSVQFSVNGTNVGTANTDNNGIATLPYTILQNSGTYTILANYLGDNIYVATSNTNNLKVNYTPTAIVLNPISGNKGDIVNLVTSLTDIYSNVPISGKTVQFSVDGNIIGTAVTDINGIATLPYTITQNGGYYYIGVLFAGDNVYNSSTGGATLKVLQSNIYVTVTSSNSHPKIGEIVKITFKVGNKGPDTANHVVLTMKIPEGMAYVSATADSGLFTYNPTTRTITWNIGNVPVGDPKLILNIKALKPDNYTIKPTITTETYDPNIQSNIGSTIIQITTTNPSNPTTPNTTKTILNAATNTIPMQHTGIPIAGILFGILSVIGGSVLSRKR